MNYKNIISVLYCTLLVSYAQSQIIIDYNKTAQTLIEKVLLKPNSGIKIQEVRYIGHKKSVAQFTTNTPYLPISNGVILCTGLAEHLDGPNEASGNGTALSFSNSNLFKPYATGETWDETILEFDFYSATSEISFEYVFCSEEYPEYVNKGVNDIFVFLISKKDSQTFKNIAIIPNTNLEVSVDNINKHKNKELFIENGNWNEYRKGNIQGTKEQLELSYGCQYDGLTKPLLAKSEVEPYTLYTLKLAIADVGDNLYDSGVLIKSNSIQSSGKTTPLIELINRDLATLNKDTNIFRINTQNNSISLVINFDFNSHTLKAEYHKPLIQLSKLIKSYFNKKVQIIGYTDNVGTAEYNQKLSEQRAEEVYKFLLQQDVSKNQLSFIGKGESELNKTNKAQNRKVEFVFDRCKKQDTKDK